MTTTKQGGKEEAATIRVGDSPLGLSELDGILGKRLRVEVSAGAWERVRSGRAAVERHVAKGAPVYGVNTGFGKLCNKRISEADVGRLQENLLMSHAVGAGPPAAVELVRWMLLFKINALVSGASGISPEIVERLAAWLNADLMPVVPSRGSLGASGDLAPLAHMVLPLIGLGEFWDGGERRAARESLTRRGIGTVKLGAKDGLALVNGTQFMSAYAAEIVVRARRLAKAADVISSMSLEACRGSVKPFGAGILGLRPHPGALEVGENIRRLMAGSDIVAAHADCEKVQDPYSLRCAAQVHGACRDALRHVGEMVEREINSVTDNPVLIGEEVISGGNFHGEPLALGLDYLAMALTEWASISERRTYLLLSGHDGLPELLMKETGVNSGFMIPQYTAAALVNECKVLSSPASVDTIPTCLGQEDHVSMGATSAVKCRQVMEHVETVLGIELLCAGQGLDYRLPVKPGVGPGAALGALRERVGHFEADSMLGEAMEAACALVRDGGVVRAAESAAGGLH